MSGAAALYTPQVLALATGLARWPWVDALPMQGTARSRSCGSAITLGLACDEQGVVGALGMRAHACAIGQAAAALFAESAIGRDGSSIAEAEAAIRRWLAGEGPMPDWPGLEVLDAARQYPARHGAILLAWQAARDLLPSGAKPG